MTLALRMIFGWLLCGAVAVQDSATDYVAGIRENAERIVVGEYHASGVFRKTTPKKKDKASLEREYVEQVSSAFDHSQNLVRFTRSRTADGGNGKTETTGMILRPDWSASGQSFENRPAKLSIRAPTTARDMSSIYQPIYDIRALPFAHFSTENMLTRSFDEAFAGLERAAPDGRVIQELDGMVRLELDDMIVDPENKLGYRIVLWLDPEYGNQPVRITRTAVDFKQPESSIGLPLTTTETTYEKRNDCWVPLSIDMEGHGIAILRLQLGVDWLAVNEELPEDAFEVGAFEFPERSAVVDFRIDPNKGILVGRTGFDPEHEVVPAAAPPWVVYVLTALVFALIGWFLVWKRRPG